MAEDLQALALDYANPQGIVHAGEPPFTGPIVRAIIVGRSTGRSVAVLPFLNLSGDQENEFFTDGIAEDVIAQLTRIRSLKVISRTPVMPFTRREQSLREIGATLQIATLLEGSVRRGGDRARIVAKLSAEERTGIHREPTGSLQAYQLYLQGRRQYRAGA